MSVPVVCEERATMIVADVIVALIVFVFIPICLMVALIAVLGSTKGGGR